MWGKPWRHFRPLSFVGVPYRPPQQPSHFVYLFKKFPIFSATHRQGDLSHPQVPLAGLALPPGLLSSFRYQPTNLRTCRLHAQCPLIMRRIIIARPCFHRHDCGHTLIDLINRSLHLFSSSVVSFEPFYQLPTVDWADVWWWIEGVLTCGTTIHSYNNVTTGWGTKNVSWMSFWFWEVLNEEEHLRHLARFATWNFFHSFIWNTLFGSISTSFKGLLFEIQANHFLLVPSY